MRRLLIFAAALLVAGQAIAGSVAPRQGWAVHDTTKPFAQLIDDHITSAGNPLDYRVAVTTAGRSSLSSTNSWLAVSHTSAVNS